jgi:hypothetical protein
MSNIISQILKITNSQLLRSRPRKVKNKVLPPKIYTGYSTNVKTTNANLRFGRVGLNQKK